MGLEKYKLKLNDDWESRLTETYGEAFVANYRKKVYWFLFKFKHNQSFNILENIADEHHELFIKLGCEYILDFAKKTEKKFVFYEFNDDYTIIRKVEIVDYEKKLEFRRKASPRGINQKK